MAELELPPSFNEQIRALKRGESVAKAKRFDMGEPVDLKEELAVLRRAANVATSRVRDTEAGRKFRVESGAFISNDYEAIVAVATITRL